MSGHQTESQRVFLATLLAGQKRAESAQSELHSPESSQHPGFQVSNRFTVSARKRQLSGPNLQATHHAGRGNTYDSHMQDLLAPDALIDRFRIAVTRRVAAERQIETRFELGEDPEEDRYRLMLEQAEQAANESLAIVHSEYADVVAQLDEFNVGERSRIVGEFSSTETRAINEYETTIASIKREYEEKGWVVDSLIDEQADNSPQRLLEQLNTSEQRTRDAQTAQLESVRESVTEAAKFWKLDVPEAPRAYPDLVPATAKAADVDTLFNESVEQTEASLASLRKLKLARWTRGVRSLLWFLLGSAAVSIPAGLLFDPSEVGITAEKWWPIAIGIGCCFGGALTAILTGTGYGSRKNAWNRVSESFGTALQTHRLWCMKADSEYGSRREKLLKEIEETSSLKEGKQQQMANRRAQREREASELRDSIIAEARTKQDGELARLEQTVAAQRMEAEGVYNQRREHAEHQNAERVAEAAGALQRYLGGRGEDFAKLQGKMVEGWQATLSEVREDVARRTEDANCAEWETLANAEWVAPSQLPNGLQLGTLLWHTTDIENAVSSRPELAPLSETVHIPATLPFPGNPSVIFRGQGPAAREVAERSLQAFLLRAFTSIPPSQMRVTLLDPVGLGEPFSPFMHLTDVDERLVAGRIWTEPQQIEAQLANLTEHMENVLQTYLRGDFATIESYNEMAGEVAEPYRFLVVNGFPHRFTEPAIRRILSIASSGPRCGVFLAIYHDTGLAPTNNLSLDGLTDNAETLIWNDAQACYVVRGRDELKGLNTAAQTTTLDDLLSNDGEVESAQASESEKQQPSIALKFEPFALPVPAIVNAIVRNVGEASKNAGRVEVSFGKIAPIRDRRWTSDSRRGLDIPLGRAGATKLQHARFGRGTAQHMLVAGKTGSGKSTFLHALITNAALHYSPRELRFFLIDFKKGVEFKAYAPSANGSVSLPHADVIAVESEREFGVSALKKLDSILSERGEQFRAAGVQDVGQFRDENPKIDMPRILLLIDEFQEFFVEDDALAQQASLLLDRLIRQGRAFGVHCVLGSQTLGGAYSLARSTLGQIGIRVALQCSEADAHLILAEDNTAARLLARPGEAIYNDAGGLIEGNQHFQVAYLPDSQREQYLQQLTEAAADEKVVCDPPVVFEGNKPAVLTRDLLEVPCDGPPRFALGDAVEIKPPTSVQLSRRSAGNVLVVGTAHDQTRGLLVAAAAQLAFTKGRSRVFVLHSPDTDEGIWQETASCLDLDITLTTSTSISDVLAELDRVRDSRDGTGADDVPHVLIVDGLHNYRQLRRPEDDYGFSSSSLKSPFGGEEPEPPPADPGKLFATLLSDGPERGLFVVASVDGYPAADRALGRKGLREFGTRVLFRISANDSSSLIDTPAASKLDSLRGLVYDDATGDFEKFRPFAISKDDELRRLTGAESASAETSTDEPASDTVTLEDAALDDFLVH